MKLTVKTDEFKKMVAKAVKGAGNNKMYPITSMMLIEKSADTENKLKLVSTDLNNTLEVYGDDVYTGEDFYCVVPVDIFSKLIAKLTCDKVTLTVTDKELKVTGNGTYKISLPMDEEGTVQYPNDYYVDMSAEPEDIKLTTVKNIIAVNKATLGSSVEGDCYCGYYMHNKVISSSEEMARFNFIDVCKEPILISSPMLDLVALSDKEDIKFTRGKSGDVMFDCGDIKVYGILQPGIAEYPVDLWEGWLAPEEFPSTCTIAKMGLQSIIDRLLLFIDQYDMNGAYFEFTEEGIKVKSKKANLEEVIHYSGSSEFKPFVCCVDIPMLKTHLDSIPTDTIEIGFGNESALKITSGKIVSIIALINDDEMESDAE